MLAECLAVSIVEVHCHGLFGVSQTAPPPASAPQCLQADAGSHRGREQGEHTQAEKKKRKEKRKKRNLRKRKKQEKTTKKRRGLIFGLMRGEAMPGVPTWSLTGHKGAPHPGVPTPMVSPSEILVAPHVVQGPGHPRHLARLHRPLKGAPHHTRHVPAPPGTSRVDQERQTQGGASRHEAQNVSSPFATWGHSKREKCEGRSRQYYLGSWGHSKTI